MLRFSLAGRYRVAVWPTRCTRVAPLRAASSPMSTSRASRSSAATFTLTSSWCSSTWSSSASSGGVNPLPPTCIRARRPWAWPRRKRIWAAVRTKDIGRRGSRADQGIMALHTAAGARAPGPRRMSRSSRSKSSHRWLREHFSDPYVKKAQAAGLRSRAAFKLEELLERDRLLKPGMVVVDLGAAPGGWSQYVRQALGDSGRVLALDILEMPPLAGVEFLHGDF